MGMFLQPFHGLNGTVVTVNFRAFFLSLFAFINAFWLALYRSLLASRHCLTLRLSGVITCLQIQVLPCSNGLIERRRWRTHFTAVVTAHEPFYGSFRVFERVRVHCSTAFTQNFLHFSTFENDRRCNRPGSRLQDEPGADTRL